MKEPNITRKSFIVHMDSLEVLEELTNEQCGQLFLAMRDYNNGKTVNLSGLLKAVFIPFKNQFDRDMEKYEAIVLRNRENGLKGGKPKGTQTNPVGILAPQDNPDKPDSDSKSDSDKKNESKKNPPAPSVPEIDFMGLEKEVSIWLQYKADRKEKYKSPSSIQVMVKKLHKYSNGNPVLANEIIEDAMAKNYSGFFELKKPTTPNGTYNQPVVNPRNKPAY